MWDTRSVELTVDLPSALADSVEEMRTRDPAYLRRVIRYGVARRAVYQALSKQIELQLNRAEEAETIADDPDAPTA